MVFFDNYSSNTIAGSANQLTFSTHGKPRTGRVFYRISAGGNYNYSLLFSNTIDSTYADGSERERNVICSSWKIHSLKVARLKKGCIPQNYQDTAVADSLNSAIFAFKNVTFNSREDYTVLPGAFFSTDPFSMEFESGDYMCVELTVMGDMIPYHEESMLPSFINEDGVWAYSKHTPYVSMLGCDRPAKKRIAFIGDSVTQGCGTAHNAYEHWCALLTDMIGTQYSAWNLGIGYARANDFASQGAWFYRAKHTDIAVICLGINDIIQGLSADTLIHDLTKVIDLLNKEGVKIVLQSIPPFNFTDELLDKWNSANTYLKNVLSQKVDCFFDIVPHLAVSPETPNISKFDPHPDREGCTIWANALYQKLMSSGLL